MPHEVPLTVSEPVLVVTVDTITKMPQASSIPFAAVPVIARLPAPVAAMLALYRKIPMEPIAVPHDVPLAVTVPLLVVTRDPDTSMPRA